MDATLTQSLLQRSRAYGRLMRLDRPVGTLLLLWPTLAALWLAAEGTPAASLILIFAFGTLVMRAAGCVINDYADRNLDGHVRRTQARPLATGEVREKEALLLFAALLCIALILVLLLNLQTQRLAVVAVGLAALYPFMKRYTYLPQVFLGAAFSWAIIMAHGAHLTPEQAMWEVPPTAWLLFVASLLWIVAYDTLYAMVDRADDLKIGIKSTAILFGEADRIMVGILQALCLLLLILLGLELQAGPAYYLGLAAMAALFGYQQYLIRERDEADCFRAFGNNVWVGFAFFAGVVLDLSVLPWLMSAEASA
jgi:4-hydroxybenzoate polyprenyltransferase